MKNICLCHTTCWVFFFLILENFQNTYALFFRGLHASAWALLCNLQCMVMCGLQARQCYRSCNLYTHFKPQTNALLYTWKNITQIEWREGSGLVPFLSLALWRHFCKARLAPDQRNNTARRLKLYLFHSAAHRNHLGIHRRVFHCRSLRCDIHRDT